MNREELMKMKRMLTKKVVGVSSYDIGPDGSELNTLSSFDFFEENFYKLVNLVDNQKAVEIIESFIEKILIVMFMPDEYKKDANLKENIPILNEINEIGVWPDFTFYFDSKDIEDMSTKKIKEKAKPISDYIRIELYDFSCNGEILSATDFFELDKFVDEDKYLVVSLETLKQVLINRGFSIDKDLTVEKIYENYRNGQHFCLTTVDLTYKEDLESPGR